MITKKVENKNFTVEFFAQMQNLKIIIKKVITMNELPDVEKMIKRRKESIEKEEKRREKIIEKIQKPFLGKGDKKCLLCMHYEKETEEFGYCKKHGKKVPAYYFCEHFEHK